MSNKKPLLYIGVMSGTSADGIDLALVDFSEQAIKLIASFFQPYTQEQHQAITELYLATPNELDKAHSLDVALAKLFAKAINRFLISQKLTANDIVAIGNHGQTIRHRPNFNDAFTLQIGCNQTLATLTNIRVIGDFRKKDMIYGGQGAPLVPAFHRVLFTKDTEQQSKDIVVVNIGGIANISFLPAESAATNKTIVGFDTGPGNALMDAWYQLHNHDSRFDLNGNWAASGSVIPNLLKSLLNDSYFKQAAPKSTGREYFHLPWLEQYLTSLNNISPPDIQATLLALTVISITNEIKKLTTHADIYLCGGGALNHTLVNMLQKSFDCNFSLQTTNQLNIDGDALEAMAFAWFAYAFDNKIFGNIPSATGASKALVLGVEFNL